MFPTTCSPQFNSIWTHSEKRLEITVRKMMSSAIDFMTTTNKLHKMSNMVHIILLIVFIKAEIIFCLEAEGPRILSKLPDNVDFSNDTGRSIECSARAVPQPLVNWIRDDGMPVIPVPGLRQVLANGTLYFLSFGAKDYRQDVHASVYRCMATNPLGTVVSKNIHIRAVVNQYYEVQVYDEYVIRGNTAVLTCQIPTFVHDYVVVTSWVRQHQGKPETIIESGGRYSFHQDGVLHIRDVVGSDSNYSYRCRTQHRLTGEVKTSASAGRIVVTDPQSSVLPRIAHSRESIEVTQGERIQLPCVAHGFPIPQYRWELFAKEGIAEPVRFGVSGINGHMVDGTLVFRSAKIEDSATYICIVNNSLGVTKAETILSVSAPLGAFIQPERQVVDEGRSATFSCTITGHPVTYISWIKDGKFLAMDDRIKLLSREILYIQAVNREDRGMYQCIGRNEHSSIEVAAELKLGDAPPIFLHVFQEQTMHSGSPLSLKCASSGNPPAVVQWTLDETLLRNADVYVDARGDVVSYINISKTNTEDGGLYRCISSNRVGSIEHSANINIYGPPFVRAMSNVTAVAEKDTTLKCHTAGYPIHSIHWEKDGTMLPTNHRQTVFPNGTLVIKKVNRLSDAGYYTCVATNRQGQSAQRPVHLSIQTAPVINPFFFPTNLRVGVRAALLCFVIEGDKPITITWLKDNEPIPDDLGVTTRTLEEHTNNLAIESVSQRHNGNFTCVATNGVASVRHTARLFVNVPPRWTLEPQNSSAILHHPLHLDCQAEGSPPPRITWRVIGRTLRDYKSVESLGMDIQEAANGSLIFRSAKETHEGYFLCQASNGIGAELSKVIYLDVQVPAHFEAKFTNQSVIKGKDVVLVCSVHGDGPIVITWKLMGSPIDAASQQRFSIKERPSNHGMTSELMIVRAERRDTATYLCHASNPYGRDEAKIHVVVKECPEAPKSVMVFSKESRSALLTWSVPFDGNSPIIRFIVQHKIDSDAWSDASVNITVPGSETTVTVKALRPAVSYRFRVTAENDVGVGPSSSDVAMTTDEEAPEGPPLDIKLEASGSRSLKIMWKPPMPELCNGEIHGYRIGYREFDSMNAYTIKTFLTPKGTPLTYMLNDLKKFTKYGIIVEAYNRIGAGPQSIEVQAYTPEDVPSKPPQNVKCTTLNSQALRVEWEPPPVAAHHGLLRGYKVSFRGVDKIKEEKNIKNIAEPEVLLDGLMKYMNYSLKVFAYNTAGDGKQSEPIFCRTDEDVPSSPTEVKALVMSSDAVLLSWRPPSHPNGIITKYTVYMRETGHGDLKPMSHTVPPTQLYYEARGLKEEKQYDFWTTASTVVGEGERTKVVSQSPISIVHARIASFPDRVTVGAKEDVRLECRAVGIPTPDREWRLRGERILEKSRYSLLPDGTLHISNVRMHDSGNYSCRVYNIYATDEISYELLVKGFQGKDAPPTTPVLEVVSRSKSSLTLSWTVDSDARNPIGGLTLNYRESSADWKELRMLPDIDSHTFHELKCGTNYQFYATAYNSLGTSERSDLLSTKTQGFPPEKPDRDSFLRVNTTHVELHMGSWSDGGCPISAFVIEHRLRDDEEWTKMTYDADAALQTLLVVGLHPDSQYMLRVTAKNEAGGTRADYDISTLSLYEERIVADKMPGGSQDLLTYLDMNIIIPVATIGGIIILTIAIICIVFQCRRGLLSTEGGCAQNLIRTLMTGRNPESKQPESTTLQISDRKENLKSPNVTPSHFQDTGVHDDICPYATYQLPVHGTDDAPTLQLQTFTHLTASKERVSTRTKGNTKHHHSKIKSERVSTLEPSNEKIRGDSTLLKSTLADTSMQSHWLPDTTDTREVMRMQPYCRSALLPSAPPAEGESTGSDFEHTDVEVQIHSENIVKHCQHRNRPLQRVPDLLYHRPDSSTSNESSDCDRRSLPRDVTWERFPQSHQSHAVTSKQSPGNTPEKSSFHIVEPVIAPPEFGDHLDTTESGLARANPQVSAQVGSESILRQASSLAVEEEELIALLKRGQLSGETSIAKRGIPR